jgi:prophage antirepressor-like protein
MVVAKTILVHGAKRYAPGDTIQEESESEINRLIKIGVAEIKEEDKPKKEKTQK